MSNLSNILGSLMQAGLSSSGNQRMKNTLGAGGQSSSGGISDILGSLMGGGSKQSGGASTGGLGDLLSGAMSQLGNNKAAVGGLGALMGSLLGGGGDSAKGAMGGGAMAMLASLAFSALQGKDSPAPTQAQVPLSLLENPTDEQKEEVENEAGLIIRAMINAAKADGEIDPEEMQRIVGKLEEDGIDDEERQQLQDEIKKPFDLDGLVVAVGNNSQLAAQVYIASLLAIEIDTDEERQYIQQLATGLGLSDQSVSNIKMAMGVA